MKNIFLILSAVILLTFSQNVLARSYQSSPTDVYVNGYYKSNGTYVEPYYRSSPDGITTNNYSCIDNGNCGDAQIYTPQTNKGKLIFSFVKGEDGQYEFEFIDNCYVGYHTYAITDNADMCLVNINGIPDDNFLVVGKSKIIRDNPNSRGKSIGYFKKGDLVRVIHKRNGWYFIGGSDKYTTGWITSANLSAANINYITKKQYFTYIDNGTNTNNMVEVDTCGDGYTYTNVAQNNSMCIPIVNIKGYNNGLLEIMNYGISVTQNNTTKVVYPYLGYIHIWHELDGKYFISYRIGKNDELQFGWILTSDVKTQ